VGSRRLQPRDVVGEEVDGRCTRLLQVLESGRSRGRQKSLESGEQRQVRTGGEWMAGSNLALARDAVDFWRVTGSKKGSVSQVPSDACRSPFPRPERFVFPSTLVILNSQTLFPLPSPGSRSGNGNGHDLFRLICISFPSTFDHPRATFRQTRLDKHRHQQHNNRPVPIIRIP
jgi:hypothetical protein